ncbi:MAG: hypothetical protein U9Q30_10760 [Campylobacterota bacterium]|nr:hypothetical protein [Campylobacterota bacterium]
MYLDKHNNFYMVKKKIISYNHTKDSNSSFITKELKRLNNKIDSFDSNLSNKTKQNLYNSIKLNYIDFKDIENFLKVYEDTIKYQFVTSSKILLIRSTKEDFNSIKQFIKLIDILPSQLKLKVTIVDTNLDKLKEFGFNHQLDISNDNDTNFFFNLVAYPFTVSNDVPGIKKDKFYTFLKMINNNGNSKLVSSPVLTLSDNKLVDFEVGTTIPYTLGNTIINDDTSKTTTSINYKDVGLKLSATPRIYNDKLVYIDLDLEVSNIISNIDNIPIVSKKHIKQSFYLDTNKIFVLTGINQTESIQDLSGIPYLMDIPFLGWLFKYESNNDINSNLSIFFEILNEDKVKDIFKVDNSIKTIIDLNSSNLDDSSHYNNLHEQRVNEILGIE